MEPVIPSPAAAGRGTSQQNYTPAQTEDVQPPDCVISRRGAFQTARLPTAVCKPPLLGNPRNLSRRSLGVGGSAVHLPLFPDGTESVGPDLIA